MSLKLRFSALLLIAFMVCGRITQAADRPPNIVLIFTDDQGYNDVGCYGSPTIKTPRLDKMAAEGMRFTDFYVAASICTPSRAGLMTGCYPIRVGMAQVEQIKPAKSGRVLYPDSKFGLHPDEITIAEVLKTRGYATACIGKWHLGDDKRFLPTRQGFDSYFGTLLSNDMEPQVMTRGEETLPGRTNHDTLTRQYTAEAEKIIRQNKDKPFFLHLAHNMPHIPLGASEGFKGRSARGPYGDAVEELDWSVGKLLDLLKELGIDEQTLVIYTSDNGPFYQRGEDGGSAVPLRASKATTYEGGFRVPCIVRYPGIVPPGVTCREVASTIDFLPTFAALAGAALPDRTIDGKNILPLLRNDPGAKSPHEAFYFYAENRLNAVRSGKWKLKLETTLQEEDGYGKPEHGDAKIPMKLFDLELDPGEQKSVLDDHPDVKDRLLKLAEVARKELGDDRTGIKGAGVRPVGDIRKMEKPNTRDPL